MPPPSERQKKRARDEARAARWAHENAPQAPTTTAPGGLELESVPSWSRAAAPQLPALLDGSSDEDEPVSGVRIDASPGKPDFFVTSLGRPEFFVTLTTVDEFSCARRRQDVTAAAFALRHLTLETQSRGKLHPHGIFYAVRG